MLGGRSSQHQALPSAPPSSVWSSLQPKLPREGADGATCFPSVCSRQMCLSAAGSQPWPYLHLKPDHSQCLCLCVCVLCITGCSATPPAFFLLAIKKCHIWILMAVKKMFPDSTKCPWEEDAESPRRNVCHKEL